MERTEKNSVQLRQEAEARVERKQLTLVNPQPGEELLHHLLHELRVHQVELEMQNEALRQTQIELEKSRDRYVDLYDFSPVGYLTLSRDAMIDEINLTGAALLGLERSKLTHRRFANFIVPADIDRWHRHFISVLKSDHKLGCELMLKRGDESNFYALLDCLCLKKEGLEPVVRIVLTDISERKKLEATQS